MLVTKQIVCQLHDQVPILYVKLRLLKTGMHFCGLDSQISWSLIMLLL
jgi:hypothetical protein